MVHLMGVGSFSGLHHSISVIPGLGQRVISSAASGQRHAIVHTGCNPGLGLRQTRGVRLMGRAAAGSDHKGTNEKSLPDLSKIKCVLFDVDGTLTDSDTLHFKAFTESLQKYGYNDGKAITREFFDEHLSGGQNNLLGKFLWPDWPKEKRDAYCDEKEALFRELAVGVLQPLAGLNEYLAWIDKQGIKKCAVTNAPKANAEAMLDAIGLGNYFEHVILGETFEFPKPYPDPYLAGLEKLGMQRHEALVHEDSPSGTSAGVAAQIPVIGILTSQTAQRLTEAGTCYNIKDYTGMLDLIKEAGL